MPASDSASSSEDSYDESSSTIGEAGTTRLLGLGSPLLPQDADIDQRLSFQTGSEDMVTGEDKGSDSPGEGAVTTSTPTGVKTGRDSSLKSKKSSSCLDLHTLSKSEQNGTDNTGRPSTLSPAPSGNDSLGSSKGMKGSASMSDLDHINDQQGSERVRRDSDAVNDTRSLHNDSDAPRWGSMTDDPALLPANAILDSPAERADEDDQVLLGMSTATVSSTDSINSTADKHKLSVDSGDSGSQHSGSGGSAGGTGPSRIGVKRDPKITALGARPTMSTPALPKVTSDTTASPQSKRQSVDPSGGLSAGHRTGSRLAQVMLRRSTAGSRYNTDASSASPGANGVSVRVPGAKGNEKARLEKLDRSEWLAMAMRKHPEVLELRERLRPLSRASSFARIYNAGSTEVRQTVSRDTMLTLVMQHLWCEGLRGSVKCLEEESGVKFENSHHGDSQLRHLVRVAVRDADKVFDLTIGDRPTDHDPEVEFHDHLNDLGVMDNEEDTIDDEHMWQLRPDGPENIILADGDDPECRTVKAATLNKLIERLTSDKTADLKFQKTFLLTHRSFTTSEKLLEKLIQRYDVPADLENEGEGGLPSDGAGGNGAQVNVKQLSIQLRVFNFLRNWIENCFFDFTPSLVQKLNNFIDNKMARDGNQKLATQLRMTIQRQLDGRMKTIDLSLQFSEEPPDPKVPRNIFSPKLSFEDLDEEEVARQLCLVEFAMFAKIKPAELLNQAWSKPKLKYRAPNVLAMISRFNQFSSWVASMIIGCERLRHRKAMMARFVKVAESLRKLNNFNTLMAVVAGLNNSAVHRLKITRDEMPKRQQESLAELVKLMSSDSAYKAYRKALQQSEPPAIPYVGVYLTDLTFVEEGNPDSKNGLVNFAKRQLVCNVISELQQYQQTSYNLQEVLQITRLFDRDLRNLPSEQELYRLSLEREPRGCTRSTVMQ